VKNLLVRTTAVIAALIGMVSARTGYAQSVAAARTAATPAPIASYVPNRVYDSRKNKWIDFETLVQRANAMDIVFVGEQHDNTPGHEMERALLEGIARRRGTGGGPVTLSLEMFERDVQEPLNAYLNGTLDETTFLAASRPWPNYGPDYRPLVQLSKAQKWPVIAANIPRTFASLVSRGGLNAFDTLSTDIRRTQIAADISCPDDRYGKLFKSWFGEAMNGAGHGAPAAGPTVSADSLKVLAISAAATEQRYYEAQCVKDETMGESIALALSNAQARGNGALVVHMNGSFHTDYGLGTADRALRRAKGAKNMVITMLPTPDLDAVDAKPLRKKADYIVFTVGKPES
ncbi:MAG: ChaN family lipoprotein, partial [Gemmatimonadaceae bacterium]